MLPTAYNNKRLQTIVLNQEDLTAPSYYELKNKWVQRTTPIFMKPTSRFGRSQFYAPYKLVGNLKIDTLFFNMVAIWIMIIWFQRKFYYGRNYTLPAFLLVINAWFGTLIAGTVILIFFFIEHTF